MACTAPEQKTERTTTVANHTLPFTEIIKFENGWGYKIYVDNKIYITQNVIPGVPGNTAFRSSKEAQKVANLVLDKINKGILPPTITVNELKELHIYFR